MRNPALLAAAALAVAAGCGGGDDEEPAPRPLTQVQERALRVQLPALVRLRPEALGYTVRWEAARAGTRAQVDTGSKVITLFPRRGDAAHLVAHDLAHELGHAFDQERLSDRDRRAYLTRRGAPRATWLPPEGAHDYDTGAEDFAEVFALCHAASPEFRSRLAPRPDTPCGPLPRAAAAGLARG